MMRNLVIAPITDKGSSTAAMAPVTGPARAAGGITGTGITLIVEHTGDNLLARFRFQFASHEDGGGRSASSRPAAARSRRARSSSRTPIARSSSRAHGATVCRASPSRRRRATVKTHDLDVPRIGYIHSWGNTQDEGWVRAALDYYKIPYTYFGENEVVKRDLRAQFDVILWPTGGGVGQEAPTSGDADSVQEDRGVPGAGLAGFHR